MNDFIGRIDSEPSWWTLFRELSKDDIQLQKIVEFCETLMMYLKIICLSPSPGSYF